MKKPEGLFFRIISSAKAVPGTPDGARPDNINSFWGEICYKADTGKTKSLFFLVPGSAEDENLSIKAQISNPEGPLPETKARKILIEAVPLKTVEIESAGIAFKIDEPNRFSFFANGYQSWTDSKELGSEESLPPMRRLFAPVAAYFRLRRFGDSWFYPYSRRRGSAHGYTYTYLRDKITGKIRLIGSLGEKEGYTVFTRIPGDSGGILVFRDCRGLVLDPGKDSLPWKVLDLADLWGEENPVFDGYHCLSASKIVENNRIVKTGWTSWYNYYEKVTEKDVLNNLSSFSKLDLPIDIFQIDDGWQGAVGDWLTVNNKFPSGMKFIASEIKRHGYEPGLWLAPFVAESSSRIFKEKPDWFRRDIRGKLIAAGNNPFNWSGLFYALDLDNNEVREYLREVFHKVTEEWGYSVLKLDFLYAAALYPPKGKTRGGAMYEALHLLRDLSGKAKILGCGVPLGTAFGFVEYCRIGSDVALIWEDARLKLIRYRERVSTINSLTSTIGRRGLNSRFFLNDPDVFILREENQKMNPEQRKTLFILNQIFGGLVFTSDNPEEYSKETLNLYKSQFPFSKKEILSVIEEEGVLFSRFTIPRSGIKDSPIYLGISNLTAQEKKIPLEPGKWTFEGRVLTKTQLNLCPYETILLVETPGSLPAPVLTAHLFPGSDITAFSFKGREISVSLDPSSINGETVFLVPEPGRYTINGQAAEALKEGNLFFYLSASKIVETG